MMDEEKDDFGYEELVADATGSLDVHREYKEVVYPFDRYEITVRLSPDNKFIGISGVKINKDFLSYKQRMISEGFHDVDEFYTE